MSKLDEAFPQSSTTHARQFHPTNFVTVLLASAATFVSLPGAVRATDYFVGSQYDYEHLESLNLQPGDRVLLQGGMTFTGRLKLEWWDSGNDGAGNLISPIVISSFGEGRATIAAGDGPAILAYNTGGIEISNLNLVGSGVAPDGTTTNTTSGINFYNDSPGDLKFHHLRIKDVEVSGFGVRGISIGGYNGDCGYADVEIANVYAHGNRHDGIETYGYPTSISALTNVRIRQCVVSRNCGDPSSSVNSGNGIVLGAVTGGLIEWCEAYENGTNCTSTNGPVGIWAYNSSGIVIQHNQSHHNATANGDGGGFDLDLKVTGSVMQYNYSHDNEGAGFLVYGTSGLDANAGNIVRYNISENDGRDGDSPAASGINVSNNVDDLAIYGNTVLMAASPGSTTVPAIKIGSFASQPDGITVANNIFVTSGDTRMVDCDTQGAVAFAGNNYWAGGAALAIRHNGQTFSSLTAWRNATGQERLAGQPTGLSVDPLFRQAPVMLKSLLVAPHEGLAAFKLSGDSPLVDKGLDLKAGFGIEVGRRDFFGATLGQGAALEIGAHEFAVSPPTILGCTFDSATGSFKVRYQSEIGESFAVKRFSGLTGNPSVNWDPLPSTAAGNGTEMEYADTPPPGERHFYILQRP
jgi:hypothetical protein